MIRSKKILFPVLAIIFLFLVLSGIKVSANEKQFPSEVLYTDIDETVNAYVDKNRETTAGLAVGIFDHSEVIYTDYFGHINLEKELPVTKDSVFEWGSVTKLLVWVSVMQLWEQGNIDLEEDISVYLPESFLDFLQFEEPITMSHLMTHQAGFQDTIHDLFTADQSQIESLEESLLNIKMSQIYPPGEFTAYSNYGTALAAYIVENISGLDFTTYVHQNIFQPLGMNRTSLSVDLSDNDYVKNKIAGYAGYDTSGQLLSDQRYSIALYPAGYAIGTLEDFMKFGQAFVPNDNRNTKLFHKSETLNKMLTPLTTFENEELTQNAHGLWGTTIKSPLWGIAGTPFNLLQHWNLAPKTALEWL